jgi:tetratricopeptide (TPR) repeat protein/transcriptional regulator with XRE-family HTH domain
VDAADEQDGSFGAILHRYRVIAGLTQEELAERAGLSVRALRDMERGRTLRPYRQSVQLVADALTLAGQARTQLIRAARAGGADRRSDAAGSGHPAGNSPAGNSPARDNQARTDQARTDQARTDQARTDQANGGANGRTADDHYGYRPGGWPMLAAPVPAGAGLTGPEAVIPMVPMQLPAGSQRFTGRAAELKDLAALLDQRGGPAALTTIVAVTGTAGVGKTTLAVHWSRAVSDRFPDGQLFVDLRGFDLSGVPTAPAEVIRGFLEALQVPPGDFPASPAAQAGLYRSLTAQRAMLVVLDNARDADQVRPLLPGGRSCLVVVTSRNELPGLTVAVGAHPVSLDVMSEADARELLAGRLGPQRLAAEPEAVSELVALCARLPLALAIVASRAAARPQISLALLAAQLRNVQARLDSLGTGEAATSVRAVFSWSYTLLRGPAARMFRLLGLQAGPDISVPAAASLAGLPAADAAGLLRELSRAHLIEDRVPGRYGFHDLLRTYAAELAAAVDGQQRSRAAVERVLDHYLHTGHAAARLVYPARELITLEPRLPGVRPEVLADHAAALAWFTAEHETLIAACAQAVRAGLDRHAWQLPWTMMHFLDLIGRWDELAATQAAALAATRRLGDLDGQAHAHCDLGRAYVRMGRLEDADTQLRSALRLREQLGGDAPRARIHLDVSQLIQRQGDLKGALAEAELSLTLFRSAGSQAGQARALNNIGWIYAKLGDPRRGAEHCEQAVALNREIGNRSGEAASLDSLGYAYLRLGRYGEAAACCRAAQELFLALGDRYNRAVALVHLGDARRASGHGTDAREIWRQALDILDDLQHAEAAGVRKRLEGIQPGAAGPVGG